jgi:hypothetical protein
MRPVFRQGDVVLRKRTKEEFGNWDLKALSEGESKVAERLEISGETGKVHVLEAPVHRSWNGSLLVVLDEPKVLQHPDHEPLVIPPGIYEVVRARSEVGLFGRSRVAYE